MRRLWWLPLAVGCADGPDEATLVDELRILAIERTPPEAAPGEEVALRATIADPLGTGADVLLWHCTPGESGCLEADAGLTYTWSTTLDDPAATTTVPVALAGLASDEPFGGVLVWALACEPGLCPQVAAPTDWDLADPTTWLADLPMSGVSLAFHPLSVSTRPDRVENPILTPAFDSVSLAPGDSTELVFEVELSVEPTADSLAFGYATGGGFEMTEYVVGDDGEVRLTWFAPDDPGKPELFVVVQDGQGGVSVWTATALVE